MDEGRMAAFERLLDQDDHALYGWIVGTGSPPAEFQNDVLTALRQFAAEGRPGARD